MSVGINFTIQYHRAKTERIVIELHKGSAFCDIDATAYDPNGNKIETKHYAIGDITQGIRAFIPDPAACFNAADQWLATELGGTYEPNTDVII